jgi:hypothetical protein
VLARLAVGTLGVWRLARRGARVDDGRWLALAQRTAGRLGISRPTTLLKGGTLGVPVTWGIIYPVVLLPAEADGWDAERRRYVLVHELAHVRRFDALTQLVAQLAVAVFWFNPLVWYAAARMRLEREHACDDYVLREGTPASRYADDLLTMVRALGTPAHQAAEPAFAALAMARRSEFEGRMLAILDAHHDRHPLTRRGTAMLAAALLALGLPLAALTPAPTRVATTTSTTAVRDDGSRDAGSTTVRVDTQHAAAVPAAVPTSSDSGITRSTTRSTTPSCSDPNVGRRLRGTHIHTSTGDGGPRLVEFVLSDAERCAEATLLGAVSFTADERDVAALAPGGMASFRERTGGREWSLRVTADRAGALAREVTRDGRAAPYDDEARAWLAGFLPEVLREAAIDARGRVARLRARGGVPAVLADIGRIRSSGAKRAHYEALLDDGTLSGADAERVTRQAAGDLASSGDLSAVLQKVPRRALTTPGARAAVGEAVGRIASSGDRRETLETLAPTADRDLLLRLAEAARGLPSSGDKAEFLRTAASYYLTPDDDGLRAAYFGVATTVPSSGDLRDVLMHALPFARAERGVTEAVLDAAGHMASSGDRSDVLVALAEGRLLTTRALRDAYVRAAEALPSSGDRARVLAAALEHRI